MQVKWAHASSKHVVGGVSRQLVSTGLGGHHARDTEMERQMNYNWCFMAVSSVHTQKDPFRDSDLLVLTVCCYWQKNKTGRGRERKKKKKSLVFLILSAKPEVTRDVSGYWTWAWHLVRHFKSSLLISNTSNLLSVWSVKSLTKEFVFLASLRLKGPWKHIFSISEWVRRSYILTFRLERFWLFQMRDSPFVVLSLLFLIVYVVRTQLEKADVVFFRSPVNTNAISFVCRVRVR